jgi:hypothetical protein
MIIAIAMIFVGFALPAHADDTLAATSTSLETTDPVTTAPATDPAPATAEDTTTTDESTTTQVATDDPPVPPGYENVIVPTGPFATKATCPSDTSPFFNAGNVPGGWTFEVRDGEFLIKNVASASFTVTLPKWTYAVDGVSYDNDFFDPARNRYRQSVTVNGHGFNNTRNNEWARRIAFNAANTFTVSADESAHVNVCVMVIPPEHTPAPVATVATNCVYNSDTMESFYNIEENWITGNGTITYNPEKLNNAFGPNQTVTYTIGWTTLGGVFQTGNSCPPAPTETPYDPADPERVYHETPDMQFTCAVVNVDGYTLGEWVKADVSTLNGEAIYTIDLTNDGEGNWSGGLLVHGVTIITAMLADGTTMSLRTELNCASADQPGEGLITETV